MILIKTYNDYLLENKDLYKIYFTVGISGSGKSTYLNKHFRKEVIVSSDQLRISLTGDVNNQEQNNRVFKELEKKAIEILDIYGMVVVDATNLSMRNINNILKPIKETYGEGTIDKPTLLIFQADPEVSKQRVKNDIQNNINRSNTPDHIIDKQYQSYLLFMKDLDNYGNSFNIIYI